MLGHRSSSSSFTFFSLWNSASKFVINLHRSYPTLVQDFVPVSILNSLAQFAVLWLWLFPCGWLCACKNSFVTPSWLHVDLIPGDQDAYGWFRCAWPVCICESWWMEICSGQTATGSVSVKFYICGYLRYSFDICGSCFLQYFEKVWWQEGYLAHEKTCILKGKFPQQVEKEYQGPDLQKKS